MKRFEQMKKQLKSLQDSVNPHAYDSDTVNSITSQFDMLFELTWKTLKEYLFLELGILEANTGSPKVILRIAYAQGIINDSEIWLSILKDRNDDTHRYREATAMIYKSRIECEYLPLVLKLVNYLAGVIPSEEITDIKVLEELINLSNELDIPLYKLCSMYVEHYGVSVDLLFEDWGQLRSWKPNCLNETEAFK